MRRYPHMNDSRMSTCWSSTSTSYCWRSDVWLPLKRLPGRSSEDDEFGRNCVGHQQGAACIQWRTTHSVGGKGPSQLRGRKRQRCRGRRGEGRGLRSALVVGAIIDGRHGGGDVPGWGVHVGGRRLGVGLGRWQGGLARGSMLVTMVMVMVMIILVGAVVAGGVEGVGARIVGRAGRVGGPALVLGWRHGRLMGRGHDPGGRDEARVTGEEVAGCTWNGGGAGQGASATDGGGRGRGGGNGRRWRA
jgi:hypothetical protein